MTFPGGVLRGSPKLVFVSYEVQLLADARKSHIKPILVEKARRLLDQRKEHIVRFLSLTLINGQDGDFFVATSFGNELQLPLLFFVLFRRATTS